MSFPVSEKIDAFTNKTTAQVEKWLGNGEEFILVDTPGKCVCLFVCVCVCIWCKTKRVLRLYSLRTTEVSLREMYK